jgi:hypothetical protein
MFAANRGFNRRHDFTHSRSCTNSPSVDGGTKTPPSRGQGRHPEKKPGQSHTINGAKDGGRPASAFSVTSFLAPTVI